MTAPLLGPIGDLGAHARHYAQAGLEVFPADPRHKSPLTDHGLYDGTTDTGTVEAWWSKWPGALIATRIPVDLVLLDVDPRHGGLGVWLALKEAMGGVLPVTRAHQSGRGDLGTHFWWLRPAERLSTKAVDEWAQERGLGQQVGPNRWTAGIDLLHHTLRYSILPPSPHPDTGQPYRWHEGRGLETEPAAMPALLADLLVVDEPAITDWVRPASDGDSIADWYSTNASWRDLLGRHGWRVVAGDGDSEGSRWRHPEATTAHSATIRHGCLFVYTTSTAFEPTEDGRPHGYTLFRAFALLDHGDDMSAAGRAAREQRDGIGIDDMSWAEPTTEEQEPEERTPRAEWLTTYETLPFPLDAYPPPLQVFATQVAASTCVSPDMVAGLILPVAATAIGNSRVLRVKDDWSERPRIFFVVIADAGTKKSPAQSKVVSPINAIQHHLDVDYARRKKEYAALDGPTQRSEEAPQYVAIIAQDVTIEAFAHDLAHHPRGMLLERDELTGWLRSFGEYKGGGGGDRQKWLEMWSGKTLRIRRRNDPEPVIVDDPFVCVLGGVQPAVVSALLNCDDGFAQRFLFCVPEPVPADDDRIDTPPVEQPVRAAYEAAMKALYALPMQGAGTVTAAALMLPYAAGAQEALHGQIQRLINERRSGDLPPVLRSYWAKMEGYLPRIAIVLTEMWHVCGADEVLTVELVESAAAVSDYFKGQALLVLGDDGVVPPEVEFRRAGPEAVFALVDWIRCRGGTARFRDVMTSGPRAIRNLSGDEARKVVVEAAERGLVTVTAGRRRDQVVVTVVTR